MRKTKRNITPAVMVGILLFSIAGSMLAFSCKSASPISSTIPISPTTQTEETMPSIPIKYPPAYMLEFQFTPEQEGLPFSTVKVARGSSVTVTATVTNWSDVPIEIRLILDTFWSEPLDASLAPEILPDFISFEIQQEYVTIEPGKRKNIPVSFTVSQHAKTGSYIIHLMGKLKEPVKERSNLGQGFRLEIIDNQS